MKNTGIFSPYKGALRHLAFTRKEVCDSLYLDKNNFVN